MLFPYGYFPASIQMSYVPAFFPTYLGVLRQMRAAFQCYIIFVRNVKPNGEKFMNVLDKNDKLIPCFTGIDY